METREKFEALPEIARMVSCDEVKWCNVYKWYRTDNTDANSIFHITWLNGAWYAFQEQEKKLAICEKLRDSQFDKLMTIKELCIERRGDIHWQVDVFIREVEELLNESKPR